MVIWTLARKDLRVLLRDTRAAIILMAMPVVFILVLGLLWAGLIALACMVGEDAPATDDAGHPAADPIDETGDRLGAPAPGTAASDGRTTPVKALAFGADMDVDVRTALHVALTEEQKKALQKPTGEWRSILRYARGVHAETAGKGVSAVDAPIVLKEVA